MAVRDDFAAGEVLAAADLNDTFASKLPYSYGTATPSTSVNGFLWYDENDTPPTPKFWDGAAFQNVAPAGGLELIVSESVSAVSSVSINNCFTSDYENYAIVCALVGSTTGAVAARMRVSASDDSTANYQHQIVDCNGTSITGTRTTNQTSGRIGAVDSSRSAFIVNVYNPQQAVPTQFHTTMSFRTTTSLQLAIEAMAHNVSTSYDGITIFPGSGTMSGTIRVYAYKD